MDSRKAVAIAFGTTMALAGFLLFQVQPLLGKYILPWFGGSASTWIVCLLFFQVALLAGYGYAYAVTLPLTVPRQAQLQIAILAASLLLLPITPSESWKPEGVDNPTWHIIALLTLSVGVPYITLATTTPLLSRWLTRIEPSLDPARFFAASNLGAFAGLLSYPFAFERLLSSPQHTRWWSWAYVLYAVLFAGCGLLTLNRARRHEAAAEHEPLAGGGGRDPVTEWIAYAGLGSALLLATTNAITQWSAVVPFLWVVPLSLYLLTFILAFGYQRLYARMPFGAAFLVLAGTTFFVAQPESSVDLMIQLVLHGATLFVGCMICHAEIVILRPDPTRLPKFYLAIAAGGALGGVFVALVAPVAFSDYYEHPLTLLAIAVTALVLMLRLAREKGVVWMAPVAWTAGAFFLCGIGAVLWNELFPDRPLVERVRNFYGVVKVLRDDEGDPAKHALILQQAGVDQGGQYQSPERRMTLDCGFNAKSALGLALAYHAARRAGGPQTPLKIGILGLGAGTIAVHGRTGDTLRYYEINPAVVHLANSHFTFLKEGKGTTDVLLGDARLLLDRQLKSGDAQKFDVLVLNAFRGASPPMHLMTKEAFAIYLGHLGENGILAVNFELDTFETAPLHRGLAAHFGVPVRWFETREVGECEASISWALYTKDAGFFEAPEVKKSISQWRDHATSKLVWTDQDSNLMSIINWGSR